MPWIPRVPAADVERVKDDAVPIDMDELAAEEDEAEEEETITMGPSHYQFLCDELSFLRVELANQREESCEDKFLADQCLDTQEELLWSILAPLPLTPRAPSSTPL
jgi:hypothetical protein